MPATQSIQNWLHGLTGDRTAFAEIADERDHHIEWQIGLHRGLANNARSLGNATNARLHRHVAAVWEQQRRPEVAVAIERDKSGV